MSATPAEFVIHLLDVPPWKRDDAAWFAAHPGRSHRLRIAHPGEWPEPEKVGQSHTAVRQVDAGKRLRLGFTLPDHMPPAADAHEEAAWAVFDLIWESRQRPGPHEIPQAEIWARIQLLEKGGRA
jgi:hypothetical protein